MKYSVTGLYLICLLACGGNVRKADSLDVRIGARVAFLDFQVYDLTDPDKRYVNVSNEFMDAFNSCLVTGPLVVLDRQHIKRILKEQLRSESGLFSPSEIVRMGQLLQAEYLILGNGKVAQTGADLFLRVASVRMIDVNNGQVVLSGYLEGGGVRPARRGHALGCEVQRALSR
ncbi:MAG: hypothetical protein HS115_05410 [Spirochaetales bacterium]|nr:hypothetical protein [Spirochaetales bacterium]